ncbi:hypothetical protein [Streptomyces sp. R44]|uniref:Uncharacterized protein n=1 Tax=Streptomyces sp. R44 TaxID=3238633 RepID=A0AB39SUS0_9ACTN
MGGAAAVDGGGAGADDGGAAAVSTAAAAAVGVEVRPAAGGRRLGVRGRVGCRQVGHHEGQTVRGRPVRLGREADREADPRGERAGDQQREREAAPAFALGRLRGPPRPRRLPYGPGLPRSVASARPVLSPNGRQGPGDVEQLDVLRACPRPAAGRGDLPEDAVVLRGT